MSRPEAPPSPPTQEEEDSVIEFLRRHPDFFARHAEVLAELPVRHSTGPAVSLMEKQVDVLRNRNTRLQERLDALLQTARANENRVLATNALARNLIAACSFGAVVGGLVDTLRSEFSIDAVSLALFRPALAEHEDLIWLDRDNIPAALVDFFRQCITRCGGLPEDMREVLFADSPALRSAAIVPLDREKPLGLLAIASNDAHMFEESMGSLFLELTASLASAALRHHWPQDDVDAATG